jgi:hypothetical protein
VTPPFLTYLTVFKSRLGGATLVTGLSGLTHQPDAALVRRLRKALEETYPLSLTDPTNAAVFEYLKDKAIIGGAPRKGGRYAAFAGLEHTEAGWTVRDRRGQALTVLPTYAPDIWLAHPSIPSTIGVPTPDNVAEVLELVLQLRLLTRSKNTLTSAGQLARILRGEFARLTDDPQNPFLLGVEAVAFLRQVIAGDGLLLREVVRTIATSGSERISRDEVAASFADTVERAVATAKEQRCSPQALREAREFLTLVRSTADKRVKSNRSPNRPMSAERRDSAASRSPGVLEHRVSPRLEWLTDWGYLTKEGLPKNGFLYNVRSSIQVLLRDLDTFVGRDDWADEVALSQWASNPTWSSFRVLVATHPPASAFLESYRLLRRQIGPAPLREVALLAGILREGQESFSENVARLIEFVQATVGATLSGGRYRRTPENIYVPDAELLE